MLGRLLILMVESLMIDQRIFVLKCFKANFTILSLCRSMLISVMSIEGGLAAQGLVALKAIKFQT